MQLSLYTEQDSADWDNFLTRAPMAMFLHTRRFLSYHRDRFKDISVLVRDEGQKIVGLFPAAVDPTDARRLVSHPGITFGGLLHDGGLNGERMIEALESLRRHYANSGFKSLRYKAVPYIYHLAPSGDDLYALFRLGAQRVRCDLSCAIDLANRREPSSRRTRGVKKALRLGVDVTEGVQYADQLWKVVEDNLDKKLGEKPVHTVDEIGYLHSLFPESIRFLVGLLEGQVIAGVVLFSSRTVTRAQYIASSTIGYDVSALDAVFEQAIERARAEGRRYFDFGTSNRNEGQHLSASLYRFKIGFGGGGVPHESYDLDLLA